MSDRCDTAALRALPLERRRQLAARSPGLRIDALKAETADGEISRSFFDAQKVANSQMGKEKRGRAARSSLWTFVGAEPGEVIMFQQKV